MENNNKFSIALSEGIKEISIIKRTLVEELSTKVFQLSGGQTLIPPCVCTFTLNLSEDQTIEDPSRNVKHEIGDRVLDVVVEFRKHELCENCSKKQYIKGLLSAVIKGISTGGVTIHAAQTLKYNRE